MVMMMVAVRDFKSGDPVTDIAPPEKAGLGELRQRAIDGGLIANSFSDELVHFLGRKRPVIRGKRDNDGLARGRLPEAAVLQRRECRTRFRMYAALLSLSHDA